MSGFVFADLTACASQSIVTYDLTVARPGLAKRPVSHRMLVVPLPTATLLLDSQRIVIQTGSELAYLKGAQWSARLPDLIQTRLIQSVDNSNAFKATRVASADSKYTLETDIRHFEVDVAHKTASVEIGVRLLGDGDEIIAGHVFKAAAAAPRDDAASVSVAIDEAFGQVLRQIVVWSAIKI